MCSQNDKNIEKIKILCIDIIDSWEKDLLEVSYHEWKIAKQILNIIEDKNEHN